MSVRVNLLPQEQSARQAAARQRTGVIAAGVGVLVVLAGVTLWQNGRIADADDRLEDEQAVLASLDAEVTQLQEFSELESRIASSHEQIQLALGGEVSLAGVLQDIAAVMPADAQLDSLNLTVAGIDEEAAATADGPSLGTLVATGKSLNNHAPGLERFLLELDKVAAFHDLFFTSSVLAEPDDPYPTFTVEAQLGPEILTGRYAEGLPEELR